MVAEQLSFASCPYEVFAVVSRKRNRNRKWRYTFGCPYGKDKRGIAVSYNLFGAITVPYIHVLGFRIGSYVLIPRRKDCVCLNGVLSRDIAVMHLCTVHIVSCVLWRRKPFGKGVGKRYTFYFRISVVIFVILSATRTLATALSRETVPRYTGFSGRESESVLILDCLRDPRPYIGNAICSSCDKLNSNFSPRQPYH